MPKDKQDDYEDDTDIYDEEAMEEAVENDEISEGEEGFLHGYQQSLKKKKKK